ncbi:DNA polymerase III subunit delta [Spiroplasma platyhelix]|uniref:DNA polymerase III delta subunit-like C-terminal domain-containing protein n=1 Tax=Spiroplasma platyhelix PALS-1 TaxID=1276218 RepID=A0A846TXE6_9MOLU|nr:hypothetical protein [Spiroplasma platyhelix]MBE4704369.1 hypothetical protein [Spiroplasma platyhelix PALS-1]NKE38741.1 hypothetical protein [Spiroplasma platyhelix PALS-1]UJB28952.1 DNA polymerase III subunit delta [Spiroplasma platyhelix PALS-1]
MFVFYGLDNFLLNQTVNIYLKMNHLTDQPNQDVHENDAVVSYYLEPEYFQLTMEKILNEVSSLDLFNNKKIIIINDYYLTLNSDLALVEKFITKLQQFKNDNLVIIKMLTKKLNPQFFKAKIESIFVESYNKEQLKKWIINKNLEYKIKFAENALDAVVTMFPNSLSIIDNELKQLQQLNQSIDVERIRKLSSKYFAFNPYQLINLWLHKDYVTFWFHYHSYWEKIKYDKLNLFLIATYQLELIRNIKLLLQDGCSEYEIGVKLNISMLQIKSLLKCQLEIKEINQLLVKAHEFDFKVKSGKLAKNLAIDIFFCKI